MADLWLWDRGQQMPSPHTLLTSVDANSNIHRWHFMETSSYCSPLCFPHSTSIWTWRSRNISEHHQEWLRSTDVLGRNPVQRGWLQLIWFQLSLCWFLLLFNKQVFKECKPEAGLGSMECCFLKEFNNIKAKAPWPIIGRKNKVFLKSRVDDAYERTPRERFSKLVW